MKRAAFLLLLITASQAIPAEEIAVQPNIDSVGLFKNGLCVVHSSFEAGAPGIYRWEDPPRCVHGTFFVESEGSVVVRSTARKVADPESVDLPTGTLQTDLAGATVKLTLSTAPNTPPVEITGIVWKMPEPKEAPRIWNTQYESNPFSYSSRLQNGTVPPAPAPSTGGFLVLEGSEDAKVPADTGRRFVSLGSIDRVEVLEMPRREAGTKEQGVLLFVVAKPGPVRISYLTKGATWAPSYFVDLKDAKTLRLNQTAVVKNELMSLSGVDLSLISGFPNVAFSHVDSPLWQGSTLAGFFGQLSSQPGRGGSSLMMQNTMAYNSRSTDAMSLPNLQEPGAASEDLHFESLGKQTLAKGDALSLEVAAGETGYERVVEWTVPDTRNAHGQYTGNEQGNPADGSDDPWDAVTFENPLKFPMTTASATIRDGGKFRGQSRSDWTNPGQRNCLRITKALSVQADHTEVEEPGKREQEIWIGGRRYFRSTVKGTASVHNFRGQPVTLLMRIRFSGELQEAELAPQDTLRHEGVFSVNPRHELEWKVAVAAGAEQKVTYQYTVLVMN